MVQVHAGRGIQEYILAVGKTFDVQIQQSIHQPAGVDACTYITNTPVIVKERVIHGDDHASGSRRLHDPQVGELRLGQYGIAEYVQRITLPGGHTDRALRGMS